MKAWLKEGPEMTLALEALPAQAPKTAIVGDIVDITAREVGDGITYNMRGTVISKYGDNIIVELTGIKQANSAEYDDGREIRIVVTAEAIERAGGNLI